MLEGKKMNWLTSSLICFAIALIAALFISCAPTWQGVCRHDALYCASVVGEQHETRVVIGHTGKGYHAQAQVWIDDKWQWLSKKGSSVFISSQDYQMEDKLYYPLDLYARLMCIRVMVVVQPE